MAKPTALSCRIDQPTSSRSFKPCETRSTIWSWGRVSVGAWPFDFCQACQALRAATASSPLKTASSWPVHIRASRTSAGVISSAGGARFHL
jgi:hypothetical protein